MKKLFIAAMALATIVSCSKDDADYGDLQKSQKSVTISIANLKQATRAEVEGGENAPGKNEACVTDAKNLKFLFADATGKIIAVKTSAEGTPVNAKETEGESWDYTFHKLPETVVMMGVAANSENAVEGKTLNDVYTEWMTETVNREYNKITVYSTNASKNVGFNNKMGIDFQSAGNCKLDGHNYPLYSASVRVAPAHARIEVNPIGCSDLGKNEYGYSQITLNKLTLAGAHTNGNSYIQTLTNVLTPDNNSATAGENLVWSWNILPQNVSNMKLGITVKGKNYNVAVPTKTVTVNKYKDANGEITKFDAEHIYKIDLTFLEENIDIVDSFVCVNVDVEVAKWIIVETDVDFETGKNN